jgi:hypothetical protein
MRDRLHFEQRLITPDERRDYIPFPLVAASFLMGWSGLRAEYFRMRLNHELQFPPMAQHLLILYHRTPDEMS